MSEQLDLFGGARPLTAKKKKESVQPSLFSAAEIFQPAALTRPVFLTPPQPETLVLEIDGETEAERASRLGLPQTQPMFTEDSSVARNSDCSDCARE